MTEQVPPSTSSGEGRPPAGPSATTPVPQPRPADQPVPGGQPGHPAPGAPPGQPVTPGYAAPGAPPGYGTPPGYGARPGHPVPGPPPTSPGGQPLASFTDRLLAVLIDGAILGGIGLVCAIPAVIIFFVAVGPELTAVEYQPDGTVATPDLAAIIVPLLLMEAALFAVMLVVQYVYSVEMSRRTGQTVGKRVMKIRIAPLDPTGSLTRGVLARRFLAQLGCGLVPGMSYVDGLWQLWDKPYQQCLHDKFARTVVVKVPA
ncbi:RDD family protein [Micromonospora sp. HM5-17]|uniref:RDD family protein n=1 Tax=Micromonospora sp. HM5-17 TaxID=2487710 RepID=UPI000F49C4D5|nr:RDD family protein [Micromonospora sp. HM5-17]ROT28075.1 RDD family protein [Micromonospora sp. HM5-17]